MSADEIPWLRAGDRIHVIAPSSPLARDELERGVHRLSARYDVHYDEGALRAKGYLAGDDARRTDELLRALADPRVRAIVPGRGGYGATRLLDALDVGAVREANKLLVGYSDITALHAMWARAGLVSVHASMVCAIGRDSSDAVDPRWLDAVEGRALAPLEGLTTIAGSDVRTGVLRGGNLALLHALLGTPYMPSLRGAVLLLEDVDEAPYRIDRMLVSLRQAGALTDLAGVLLGTFTGATPRADGTTLATVLEEAFAGAPYPVLADAPIGHGAENHAVRLGAPVTLDPQHRIASFPPLG